jgi:hypothetical protein
MRNEGGDEEDYMYMGGDAEKKDRSSKNKDK